MGGLPLGSMNMKDGKNVDSLNPFGDHADSLNIFSDHISKSTRVAAFLFWFGGFLVFWFLSQGKIFLKEEVWDPLFGNLFVIGELILILVAGNLYIASVGIFLCALVVYPCKVLKRIFSS